MKQTSNKFSGSLEEEKYSIRNRKRSWSDEEIPKEEEVELNLSVENSLYDLVTSIASEPDDVAIDKHPHKVDQLPNISSLRMKKRKKEVNMTETIALFSFCGV
mmetsp:Transcript_19646/g.26967  ORF Transcript_19646/g.26967 Transcript_19646/m.26967 type:complete len:103 (+) Transcript_19646:199-507(+)